MKLLPSDHRKKVSTYREHCCNSISLSQLNPFVTEQNYYLEFLEHSDLAGVVDRCSDGCSSPEIILPYDFPFGGYFHETAFVSRS